MKKFLLSILTVFAVFTLTACIRGGNGGEDLEPEPEPEPGDVIVINYWNSITGADGVMMRDLVRRFNDEYEGKYEVLETYTPENDYYDNLNLLIPQHRGPDVALIHSHRIYGHYRNDLIVPFDDWLEDTEVEISLDDYVEDVVTANTIEDEVYSIPLDLHTVGVYYNKTLLEKYDLEVPTNREEFIDAAQIVQEGERATKSNFYSIPLSTMWPSEWIYTTALYQNGGREVIGTEEPGFNDEQGILAMEAVADLIHVENLSSNNVAVDADLFMFQNGNALFHIQGSWMLNAINESLIGEEFGVFPLSNLFTSEDTETKDQVHARSHGFALPVTRREPSIAKKEAILTFVKFMGDNSFVWAKAGQIPASNIARATAEYQAIEHISDFADVNNLRVAAKTPFYQEAYGVVFERVTKIMALNTASYNRQQIIDALEEAATEARMLVEALK